MREPGASTPVRLILWPALLGAFSLFVFGWGLNAQGLSGWQESQRALVARQMFERGDWIVPTVHGEPYIAKPPFMYWCQMGIARARQAFGIEPFTDETEVRLTVAIAGALGVVATFFVARRFAAGDRAPGREEDWIGAIAGLGLASGILYARSSRTGELDVLLAPLVVIAIGAMHRSWASERPGGLGRWTGVAIATLALTGAALTKGPPALFTPLLALLGGTALWLTTRVDAPAPSRGAVRWGGAIGAAALCVPSLAGVESAPHALGSVFFALAGAGIGATIGAIASSGQLGRWGALVARSHPWIVFVVPVAALWGWSRLVAGEIGAEALARLAEMELDNNLRVLDPESPLENLGFFAYGVLPMSIATLAGLFWIGRDRPRLPSGVWTAVAWCVLGLIAFSALGKGVARYLTPLWPACAVVGAVWLSRVTAGRGPAVRAVIVATLVCSGVGLAWWYGSARPGVDGERSPRAMVTELEAARPGMNLHALDLDCPALDYYLRRPVGQWVSPSAGRGRSVEELFRRIAESGGEAVLLVPEGAIDRKNGTGVRALAAGAGLDIEPVEVRARFRWNSARSWFVPLRIAPSGSAGDRGLR